ncbi:hypothetical protein EON79_09850 [bacterium]|nr:MAG: hypothetical protein EON79_09850 [bacterium]
MLSASRAGLLVLPCGEYDACAAVSDSPLATVLGVPIAYLGFLAYLSLLAAALGRSFVPSRFSILLRGGYVVSGIGTLVSAGLIFYSVRILDAMCPWCLASAAIMAALFTLHAGMAMSLPETARKDVDGAVIGFGLSGIAAALLWHFALAEMRPSYDVATLSRMSARELAPADAPTMGDAHSKIKVVVFSDMLCPACRQTLPVLEEIVRKTPSVSLVYRHRLLHDASRSLAIASELAHRSGEFWKCLSLVHQSRGPDDALGNRLAKASGIPEARFLAEVKNARSLASVRIASDETVAKKLQVNSTPAVFIVAEGLPSRAVSPLGVERLLRSGAYRRLLTR